MKNKKLLLIIGGVALATIIIVVLILLLGGSKKYLVTFDSLGGTKVATQKVKEGEMAEKPEDPTKENFIFKEWTYEDKTFNFNTLIEKDITLVAKWKKVNPDQFSVVIDSKNGTEAVTVTVLEDELLEKPEDSVYVGYTFLGWTVNGEEYNFDKPVTRTFILEAKWEKTKAKFTVTFDTLGGDKIDSQTIEDGGKVVKPEDPKKDDATFVEWQLNGKTYDFEAEVTGNITLKAKWDEVKYTAYSTDAFNLSCVVAGTNNSITLVDVKTKIECTVNFATKTTDKVSTFKYDLKYGKGVKLVKSEGISNAKVNNGNYNFTLSNKTNTGTGGKFTFEITDVSNSSELYVGLENIKFVTTDNKRYSSKNQKLTMRTTWDDMKEKAIAYKENVFRVECDNISTVKKGDKVSCELEFDIGFSDKILKYQYDLKIGKGLKLVKAEKVENAIVSGTSYKHTLTSANSYGTGGKFTFEITDVSKPSELYVTVENISFLTSGSRYYKNDNITRKFENVWEVIDKNAKPYKNDFINFSCYVDNSVLIPKVVGTKVKCHLSYEFSAADAMTHLKFDIKTANGIKFTGVTKEDPNGSVKSDEVIGNTHRIVFSRGVSLFSYVYTMNFEITDVSDSELYITMDNIKFKTIKDEYYTNSSIKNTL